MASRSPNRPNNYNALSEDEDAMMFQHIIDIPRVMEPDLSPECCIYKVPEKHLEVNPEGYTPQFINPKLKPMERGKHRYFHFFSKRLPRKQALDNIKSFLVDAEAKLRRFYSEKFPGLSKDQFVNIMLLDSIFVMELFELYSKAFSQNDSSFLHLAYKYFSDYDPRYNSSSELILLNHWNQPKHFTDLIRAFHIPEGFKYDLAPIEVLKCATKLHNSRVIFKAVPDRCTLDIKVEKKLLSVHFKIPKLKIDFSTECVLRNLMALELCHYPNRVFICNYISVIDNLISIEEDADLLVDQEVIVQQLGNNGEVTTLINGLRNHVVTNSNCYSTHIRELNAHYLNPWNHTVARLWTVYFKDDCRGSSTILGVAVLFFTFFNFFRLIFN